MSQRWVWCLIAGALTLHAQPATASAGDISCIQRLIVPDYPALARMARIAADVTVSIVIGDGPASHQITTHVEKPNGDIRRLFSGRVEKAVRSSTFNQQCVG